MDSTPITPKLTALAHGGGCGCKLAPSVLRTILADMPQHGLFPDLLVGTETADDAAVYRLDERTALVATTDFFTPVVDDPYDFGRIAATNALSDVYAMGGRPVLALAVLGIPVGKVAVADVRRILAGGSDTCAAVGIPVAGGHSIDTLEPIYGLVALGTVHPGRVLRNSGAQPGDVLVLTKGLGIGILSAALKRGELGEAGYRTMIAATTRINSVGADLPAMPAVHACTDVTGFGLLGHALEMARGAGLQVRLRHEAVPVLDGVAALAQAGYGTGAADRNWASYASAVALPEGLPEWRRGLLCDPQTSGGLLIAAAPDGVGALLRHVKDAGFDRAAAVGTVCHGPPDVLVV